MRTVFLDLDGTLTDPRPGIVASILHALDTLGLAAPEPDTLGWTIGPPLLDSFAKLGAPDPHEALRIYRERFSDIGLFENRVYDGIDSALETLSTRYRLCLATAKPLIYAERITAHFGLARFMTREFGPDLDGTLNNKADLLAHALDELGAVANDCVMVGDRHHDFDAAAAVGMPSLGVTWGYGTGSEHAYATRLCDRPEALATTIVDMLEG